MNARMNNSKLFKLWVLLPAFALLSVKSISQQSPGIGDLQVFPADNPWNWDISDYQVHPNSADYITSIGAGLTLRVDFGTTSGIPYITVNNSQTKYPISFTYADESDPGPYPVPLNAPIEGGSESNGDRHVISVDLDNKMLYELWEAYPLVSSWNAGTGAKFDLTSNQLRPADWVSADAAGLPIFPGLIRYEEVYIKQEIKHAMRFYVTFTQNAYIWPARHYSGSNSNTSLPPMGLRLRLKSSFNISGFSDPVKVILTALKKHGMFVADVGTNWFISGAPDDRWNDVVLAELLSVHGSDFEAIQTVDENGDPIYPVVTSAPELNNKPVFTPVAFPNPFNKSTRIKFYLEKSSIVEISVFNASGQEIFILKQGLLPAGENVIAFDGENLSDGIYYYKITAGTNHKIGKLILMK